MFVLPAVHKVAGAPPHHRGMTSVRGSPLPAVDLRVCLGVASASSELEALVELLRAREQDHRNWLAELEASVRERRAFALATDPRKCKFGQWYYSFATEDAVLRAELARIERPHAAIHALAIEVEALKAGGRFDQALADVAAARNGVLAEVLRCFEEIRRAVRAQHREIGVTATFADRRCVLIVDRAEAVADVERLAEADDPVASGELRVELIGSLARWSGARQPVLLLDMHATAGLVG
jgi:purine-binding chemotaxis protein CheW